MKTNSRKIALTAIFFALIAILSFTPLGFVPIVPGVIDMAFLYLVVIIVAAQTQGLWIGVACSTFFGVCSLINAYVYPTKLMSICFQNPLISVLPRICIGFTTYFSYRLFCKCFAKAKSRFWSTTAASAFSALAGVVTNTALVLGGIALGYGNLYLESQGMDMLTFLATVVLVFNFPIELVTNFLLVPPVTLAVRKINPTTEQQNDSGN